MHEPAMAVAPLMGVATTVGVSAVVRMMIGARRRSGRDEQGTRRDGDDGRAPRAEQTP